MNSLLLLLLLNELKYPLKHFTQNKASSVIFPFLCFHKRTGTQLSSFFFNKFIYFIYSFLAALGLRCWMQAFSSCGERRLLFVAVCGLLIVVASLAVEHRL